MTRYGDWKYCQICREWHDDWNTEFKDNWICQICTVGEVVAGRVVMGAISSRNNVAGYNRQSSSPEDWSYYDKIAIIQYLGNCHQMSESFQTEFFDAIVDNSNFTSEEKLDWVATSLKNMEQLRDRAESIADDDD